MSFDRCHRRGSLPLGDALAAWARLMTTRKPAPPSQGARTQGRCRSPRCWVFGAVVTAQTAGFMAARGVQALGRGAGGNRRPIQRRDPAQV